MFSVEKYIDLFLDDSVESAFKNFVKDNNKLRVSKEKEKILGKYKAKIRELIKIYIDNFKVGVNDLALSYMEEQKRILSDKIYREVNTYYSIYLDDGYILISHDKSSIYLIFSNNDIQIKINLNINEYWKSNEFGVQMSASVFKHGDTKYLYVNNNDILVYNKETIEMAKQSGNDLSVLKSPDMIITGEGKIEDNFFASIKDMINNQKSHKM